MSVIELRTRVFGSFSYGVVLQRLTLWIGCPDFLLLCCVCLSLSVGRMLLEVVYLMVLQCSGSVVRFVVSLYVGLKVS